MAKLSFVGNAQFSGWQDMYAVREGIWVYQAPDNSQRAMVDTTTNTVLLIEDLASKEILYKDSEELSKAARRTVIKKRQMPPLNVRRLI